MDYETGIRLDELSNKVDSVAEMLDELLNQLEGIAAEAEAEDEDNELLIQSNETEIEQPKGGK